MLKGFRDFILRGNVMDLAVAVIIGAAFTGIVTALTDKIINPLLGAVIGKPTSAISSAHINGRRDPLRRFFTAIVNFLIIAAVVYFFLVLPTQYLLKKFHPAEQRRRSPNPAPSASATFQSQRRAASSAPSPSPANRKRYKNQGVLLTDIIATQ